MVWFDLGEAGMDPSRLCCNLLGTSGPFDRVHFMVIFSRTLALKIVTAVSSRSQFSW
jgi:hypothetical protein